MSFLAILPAPDHNTSGPVSDAAAAAISSREINVIPSRQRQKGPTEGEWNRHRAKIKRLYKDEDKKLEEVMSVMKLVHNFHATKKMYKTRITKWGLDKNNKGHEIAFVLRKKTERDALGKDTAFSIRGTVIPIEEARRYCKRKGIEIAPLSVDPATPPDISYWTPAPSPSPLVLSEDMEDESVVTSHSFLANNTPLSPWNFLTMGDFPLLSHLSYSISPAIEPPQALLIPEKLFANIYSYIRFSLGTGTWVTNGNGVLKTTRKIRNISIVSSDITMHCRNAAKLFKDGFGVEGRQIMSMAFSLIRDVLFKEPPDAIESFLESFIELLNAGLQEIASMLRSYIGQMAARILPRQHPWYQICHFIGLPDIDIDDFKMLLDQCYYCVVNAFEAELGALHYRTVVCRTESIFQFTDVRGAPGAEKQVKDILADCERLYGPSHRSSQFVMNALGNLFYIQGKVADAEAMGNYALQHTAGTNSTRIVARNLALIADSQYAQGKVFLAEHNLRNCIDVLGRGYGRANPWRMENMLTLEDWLWELGRDEEAAQLRTERKELLDSEDDGSDL